MNTNILKKCIEKLKNADTDKDAVVYVLGMLETLLEMQPATVVGGNLASANVPGRAVPMVSTPPATLDEAAMMDAKARAAIAEIKKIEKESLT